MSVLSSLGLNMANMQAFGFNGQTATAAFGGAAIKEFVGGLFSAANAANVNVLLGNSGADLFDFAAQADKAIAANSNINYSYTDYLNNVNGILGQHGYSLNDLHYGMDASGNITVTLDGVSSTTLNIHDLMAQAVAQAGL